MLCLPQITPLLPLHVCTAISTGIFVPTEKSAVGQGCLLTMLHLQCFNKSFLAWRFLLFSHGVCFHCFCVLIPTVPCIYVFFINLIIVFVFVIVLVMVVVVVIISLCQPSSSSMVRWLPFLLFPIAHFAHGPIIHAKQVTHTLPYNFVLSSYTIQSYY
jgi:hypothetical protein